MLGKSATSAPWRYNAALKAPKCLSSVENGAPGDQARLGGKVGWPYVGLTSFFHLGPGGVNDKISNKMRFIHMLCLEFSISANNYTI